MATLYDNTFRWETFEGACTPLDRTDVTVDIEPGGVFRVRFNMGSSGIWNGLGLEGLDEDETSFNIDCRNDDYVQKERWRVAYYW